jgi:hypothetical protein
VCVCWVGLCRFSGTLDFCPCATHVNGEAIVWKKRSVVGFTSRTYRWSVAGNWLADSLLRFLLVCGVLFFFFCTILCFLCAFFPLSNYHLPDFLAGSVASCFTPLFLCISSITRSLSLSFFFYSSSFRCSPLYTSVEFSCTDSIGGSRYAVDRVFGHVFSNVTSRSLSSDRHCPTEFSHFHFLISSVFFSFFLFSFLCLFLILSTPPLPSLCTHFAAFFFPPRRRSCGVFHQCCGCLSAAVAISVCSLAQSSVWRRN